MILLLFLLNIRACWVDFGTTGSVCIYLASRWPCSCLSSFWSLFSVASSRSRVTLSRRYDSPALALFALSRPIPHLPSPFVWIMMTLEVAVQLEIGHLDIFGFVWWETRHPPFCNWIWAFKAPLHILLGLFSSSPNVSSLPHSSSYPFLLLPLLFIGRTFLFFRILTRITLIPFFLGFSIYLSYTHALHTLLLTTPLTALILIRY